jgi:hypothetical protein
MAEMGQSHAITVASGMTHFFGKSHYELRWPEGVPFFRCLYYRVNFESSGHFLKTAVSDQKMVDSPIGARVKLASAIQSFKVSGCNELWKTNDFARTLIGPLYEIKEAVSGAEPQTGLHRTILKRVTPS